MTDFNNGAISEGTNIMVEALANPDKLRPDNELWFYNKNNNDAELDDNFTNYVSNHDNQNQNDNQNDNHHQSENNNHHDNNSHNDNENYGEKYSEKKPIKSDTNKFIDDEYENLSSLEKRLRRLDIMRALGELRDLGCKVTNYNIDDDYYMMKYELDLHRSIRAKRNWLGLYSHMLVGVVKGVELLNNNYNPFDFSIKGLSDEVSGDKNTYYEILAEIYEFHNVPGKKMNPWFRLFVSLIGAVVMVGGKNNAHKFIPNQSAKFENDEDFVEKLRAKAAKDSRSQLSHNSQNKQTQQNQQNQQENQQDKQNHLDEYMNKQHQQAAQKAKDLEELKRQELEYQRYQQMLIEQKDKFNQIKKNLEMTASPRSMMSSKSTPSNKSTKSPVKSKKNKDKDTISQMSTSTNNTTQSTQSIQSTVSKISINRNLAKKLSQKSVSDISVDQISFGSNRKK